MVEPGQAVAVAVVAACGQQHQLLAAPRQHRPVRLASAFAIKAEGLAHAHDIVDIRLELRRNAKVVHRHADHQHVGALDFRDQAIAFGQHRIHPRLAPRGRRKGTANPVRADGRGRVLAHVAVSHRVRRTRRLPAVDEAVRETARVRAVGVGAGASRAGAGVDMKEVSHVVPFRLVMHEPFSSVSPCG